MPHTRNRYLEASLRKALSFSPLVGIIGMRQTGKTTLLEQIVGGDIASLDEGQTLNEAELNPAAFIKNRPRPFGIDECQLCPKLFPALKLHVKDNRSPGQFILTGSIRFTSLTSIRESLTGRIFTLELLPMTISEAKRLPRPDYGVLLGPVNKEMRQFISQRLRRCKQSDLDSFLVRGGLPGIAFQRDESIRKAKWSIHLDTILGRDLRLLINTNLPLHKLRQALSFLAQWQGEPVKLTELSRHTRISRPTLSKLLPAFEALFLIRRLGSLGDRRHDVFYLEDQGLAHYLFPSHSGEQNLRRLCFSQVFAHLRYRELSSVECYCYETRAGSWIPMVFKIDNLELGIIPQIGAEVEQSSITTARYFLERHPNRRVWIVTEGDIPIEIQKHILAFPIRSLV